MDRQQDRQMDRQKDDRQTEVNMLPFITKQVIGYSQRKLLFVFNDLIIII